MIEQEVIKLQELLKDAYDKQSKDMDSVPNFICNIILKSDVFSHSTKDEYIDLCNYYLTRLANSHGREWEVHSEIRSCLPGTVSNREVAQAGLDMIAWLQLQIVPAPLREDRQAHRDQILKILQEARASQGDISLTNKMGFICFLLFEKDIHPIFKREYKDLCQFYLEGLSIANGGSYIAGYSIAKCFHSDQPDAVLNLERVKMLDWLIMIYEWKDHPFFEEAPKRIKI